MGWFQSISQLLKHTRSYNCGHIMWDYVRILSQNYHVEFKNTCDATLSLKLKLKFCQKSKSSKIFDLNCLKMLISLVFNKKTVLIEFFVIIIRGNPSTRLSWPKWKTTKYFQTINIHVFKSTFNWKNKKIIIRGD